MGVQVIEPRYRATLEAVVECAEACEGCGQGCIKSADSSMSDCASSSLDCAVMCRTTETFLSRNSMFDKQVATLTAQIAKSCMDECVKCESPTCNCTPCGEAARRGYEECSKLAA